MTQYFAQLDNDNIVIHIAVTSTEFMNAYPDRYKGIWVETFLDTASKHCAGIGYTYDAFKDQFVAPQPFPSWTLDSNNDWQAPTAKPNDGKMYVWVESSLAWVVVAS